MAAAKRTGPPRASAATRPARRPSPRAPLRAAAPSARTATASGIAIPSARPRGDADVEIGAASREGRATPRRRRARRRARSCGGRACAHAWATSAARATRSIGGAGALASSAKGSPISARRSRSKSSFIAGRSAPAAWRAARQWPRRDRPPRARAPGPGSLVRAEGADLHRRLGGPGEFCTASLTLRPSKRMRMNASRCSSGIVASVAPTTPASRGRA